MENTIIKNENELQNLCCKTGYLWNEKYFWHDGGNYNQNDPFTQPLPHLESAESKRRMHNLVTVSGLIDHLYQIKARLATEEELALVHSIEYIKKVQNASKEYGGDMGDFAHITKGGYEIASLSVGGCLQAVDQVMKGTVNNAYCLIRPPGHHAIKNMGMGFCIFNNIAIAAQYLLKNYSDQVKRIAIIDYDVHHGNGTQEAFYDSDQVLFISIHQDKNYPNDSGFVEEIGIEKGKYFNLNIPLPPGSGKGAYQETFTQIIEPAIDGFKPDIILVSSGFDAAAYDPLGAMILTSDDYRYFTQRIKKMAQIYCSKKTLFFHEGGYSEIYVPFCGLAVLEELSGVKTEVQDSLQLDAKKWGYQEIQSHQQKILNDVSENLYKLKNLLLK